MPSASAPVGSILLVGCGNMGRAMLDGWLRAGFEPSIFTVFDPFVESVPPGVRLAPEMPDGPFDAVQLAIKPQGLDEAAPAIEPVAGPDTLVFSLLAGIDLARLRRLFPRAGALVRVMPNLAAALGKAPIGLCGDAGSKHRARMSALADPLGEGVWIGEESMDIVTALAGSGPAFVYRFIDALASGAASLGLDEAIADRLALAMVEGAAALAAGSDHAPGELARRVASPGGTTAAGLAVLDADDRLATLIEDTLRAARDRGTELGKA